VIIRTTSNDVNPSDWYAPAIEALAAAGIIQSGTDGGFLT